MKPYFLILAACLVLALAACAGSSDSSDKDKDKGTKESGEEKKDEIKKEMPICPQVAIVAQLDSIRDYGGEKPDPAELVAGAKMLNLSGTCSYHNEDGDPQGIDVAFDLALVAAKGPHLGGSHTSFPFFVAAVDPEGDILNKELMTTDFKFSSDENTAQKTESLHVFIPLIKEKQQEGPDYQVLIGFQLTDEQLAADRK